MIESNSPFISENEILTDIGRDEYSSYASKAQVSLVPEDFFVLSKVIAYEYSKEDKPAPALVVAEMLIGVKFSTDEQATTAINYAEAMAALKMFESGLASGQEEPTKEDIDSMYLSVGKAAVSEIEEADNLYVRQVVEKSFSSPLSILRLKNLRKDLRRDRTH